MDYTICVHFKDVNIIKSEKIKKERNYVCVIIFTYMHILHFSKFLEAFS